jgi:hypothetical protein
MRELIKHILKETILLNETGIRGIRELAKRYPKAKIYFHQDLDGVTTAIGMKNYLEQHGIEVVDAEVIQYGDKEWAIKKPEGNGEIMPVLVDFAHGKPMFEIHTDHHDTQAGAEETQSTSFRSARSNVETISQTISPKEIFPAEDITLISTVDSANFTQYDISVDDVLSFLFKIDREADLKRNKMLMGLVVNKLLLAFKNKPGFLEELVLECKPSLLNILLKIKSIMKREGFDKEDILTQNQKDYIQSMNKSENVTLSDNILVQYGGGYMIPQGSYDRYTPFKNNPNADFLVIAWPVGLVQASCNPYKKDRALKGVNLGEIKDEVLEHFKSELSNQKVTFGDLKRNSEFKAKYNSVGFTFKDMMAIYGDSPSLKIEGGNKLKEILSDISDRLYKNLSPKQKQLLERVYVNGFDVIKANSGGHKCITNISGINYLYRNKKDPRLDNISNELMPIANYTGDNKFLNDIKEKLLKYGRLSERQIEVALNQLEKEKGNLDIEESNTKSYVDLVKEIQSYFVELLKDKIEKSERDSDNKKELDEYSRTLKMARRQGSGTRFPKSAVKANPNRFRKYSRLKESDIEKLDLDDLANKKEKLKKIIVKIIDKIITKATYNKDETKIFFFNKDDEFLLNYDIKGEKLWYDHELYENYIIGRIKVNFYLGTTFKEALQEWFNNKFKKEGYEVIDKWWSYEHNPNVEGANMTLY